MNRVTLLGGYGAGGALVDTLTDPMRQFERLRRFRDVAPPRAVFRHVHLGGDGFAVAVASGGRVRSFAGRRQSRATGLAAALVVRRLDGMPTGIRHIEDAVGPDFLPELAAHGFQLGEYDSG